MEELQTISTLQGVEIALRKELEHIAEGYIKVGYLLKKTRDAEFYKEKGYADVFEFAKETFNISRTWAIRFMQINHTVLTGTARKFRRNTGDMAAASCLKCWHCRKKCGKWYQEMPRFGKSGR